MGMGSCFYPLTHGNEGHWALGNQRILNNWSFDNGFSPNITILIIPDVHANGGIDNDPVSNDYGIIIE